jgi:exonuclease SbcC
MNRHVKSIRIKDFQNHEDTFLTFGPGLTVITGTSDSGKSAIYRAFMFALQNEGKPYDVREKQKNAEVTIIFKNDDYLKRTKGTVNEIEYQYFGKEIVKHSKFGTDYPKDVLEFIGHIPKTANDSLPFANQDNKLFLINGSDLSIPRDISKLLGIDDLEQAASLLNSEVTKISGDIKRFNSEIETTKTKLEPFENLDQKIESLNELKKLIKSYESLELEIDDIKKFNNNFQKTYKQYAECNNEKIKYENLQEIYNENIPELSQNYNNFSDGLKLIENISSKVSQFKVVEKKYNHFYGISEGDIGQLITECDSKHNELLIIQNLDTDIENTNFEIDSRKDDIDKFNKIITKCDEEIEALETYARENFESCESCGRFCVCQRI